MRFFHVIWDDEDRIDGNVQRIAEHGLMVEDVSEDIIYPVTAYEVPEP